MSADARKVSIYVGNGTALARFRTVARERGETFSQALATAMLAYSGACGHASPAAGYACTLDAGHERREPAQVWHETLDADGTGTVLRWQAR
jgi:hypothetical protein